MNLQNPFGQSFYDLQLPEHAQVLRMPPAKVLEHPKEEIARALANPIGCPPLAELAAQKKRDKTGATAVIVVSDNTRPVPYREPDGILMPVVDTLLAAGFRANELLVLVATGTHVAMNDEALRRMLPKRLFELGIAVVNHDCRDDGQLTFLGRTARGGEVYIDSRYLAADLRIATGLIESHFMAGVSGGRKAICPGLVGEKTTYVFHGAELMAHSQARDLQLEGNPVHEESLEIAQMAGVDFLVNVTLDNEFRITGVFAGDLVAAHLAGVKKLRESVEIRVSAPVDIVVTHAGYVGVNHYQCAKCAVAGLGVLKHGGWMVILANPTAAEPVGSLNYRAMAALLKVLGSEKFQRCLQSPDWTFVPEQWQVQQWGKLFRRIPQDHLLCYSPTFSPRDWQNLPGREISPVPSSPQCFQTALNLALTTIARETGRALDTFSIAYMADGPYAVVSTNTKEL